MSTGLNFSSALSKVITGGRAESGYYPAVIETARIVNVNVNDWTVDAVSEFANRRFFDIQVMSPYFHYFAGEGIYALPEVGAVCWIAQMSSGLMAQHFVLGYQAPPDIRIDAQTGEQSSGFRANRQSLNPGDIMLRGRDENFIILRRGGVVQLGAGPATQRMYIPVGGIIRDFCQAYNLFSLGGELDWEVDRVDQTTAGDVTTRFNLKAKTNAGEPGHAVLLTLGSQKDSPDVRLSLIVNQDGSTGAPQVVQLTIDKAGVVTWGIQSDLVVTSKKGKIAFTAAEGDMALEATKGKLAIKTGGDLSATIGGALNLQASGTASIQGSSVSVQGQVIDLTGKVNLGGSAAVEPNVLGLQLFNFFVQMIKGFTDPSAPFGIAVPPGSPMLFPGMAALLPLLNNILSQNTRTA